MNYIILALTVVGVVYILFGFYVLIRRRADHIGAMFLSIALGIAAWNLSLAAIEGKYVTSKSAIIALDRVTSFVIPIISMTVIYYLLALWGPDWWARAKQNKIVIALSILALVNLALSPTNLISNNQGEAHLTIGPLWSLMGGYVLLVSIYIIYLGYVGWKTGPEETKKKFRNMMLGYLLTALCGLIFNMLLPLTGYSSYPMLGALSTIFIVWFVGLGAIGETIAGTVVGLISSVVAIVVFSTTVLGLALSLMFILFASIFPVSGG